MPRCCGASCDCNIQQGAGIVVTGTGSIDDPFIVAATALMQAHVFDDAEIVNSAPATGTADPLPANPTGYIKVVINGEDRYFPFF
jgi:hypothetical protein